MNSEVLRTIATFENAPETEEQLKIYKQYQNDEISTLDYYGDAIDYLEKHGIEVGKE